MIYSLCLYNDATLHTTLSQFSFIPTHPSLVCHGFSFFLGDCCVDYVVCVSGAVVYWWWRVVSLGMYVYMMVWMDVGEW